MSSASSEDLDVQTVIEQFEKLQQEELSEAVKFVTRTPSVSKAVLTSLREQVLKAKFFQPLFEWLYKCIQLKSASSELYCFCLQFTPDLMTIYLNAIYNDHAELKVNAEALLIAVVLEVEREKSQTLLQVPTLSKSSVYHQCPGQLSQPLLTEAVLQRHNEVETISTHLEFAGKAITVNNRLQFLCSTMDIFCDHIMIFSPETREAFCQSCIRLALQGMGTFRSELDKFKSCLPMDCEDLAGMKRISISDGIIKSLLRGVRICLFQSCHFLATQALKALKMRAEYELLTDSIQISHTLSRLADDVQPQELELDIKNYSSYHGSGTPAFTGSPADVHTCMNSFILQHNLQKSEHTTDDVLPQTSQDIVGKIYSKSTAV